MIAVIGSLNEDIVALVPHHPVPGETVLGTRHFVNPGGKGANQATAAARLGASVAMIGRVGDDSAGRALLRSLRAEGVDATHVTVDASTASGLALITVDATGENAIVVSPGANGKLTAEHCDAAGDVIASAEIVLAQLEVPLDAIVRAAELATGRVILNPAPARPLPPSLLDRVSILVPNRSELAVLTGRSEPSTVDDAATLASELGGSVVVTLGADGALLVDEGTAFHVPAPRVDPVDTTAAGDAFCGALAEALARGEPIRRAVEWAVGAGAVAVTREGAQQSLPSAAEVRELVGQVG